MLNFHNINLFSLYFSIKSNEIGFFIWNNIFIYILSQVAKKIIPKIQCPFKKNDQISQLMFLAILSMHASTTWRWRSSIQSTKTRPGADCGSDHELLITKFRLKLKKVGKTTRPFRYDLNQIPYDYTVKVTNRFKGLDLIDRVPDDLWNEVRDIV